MKYKYFFGANGLNVRLNFQKAESPKERSPIQSLPGSPSGSDRRVCVDTLMRRMRTLSERVEEFNQVS